MTARTTRRWVMAKRPVGEPTDDCFELQEAPAPEVADGEVLIEVQCEVVRRADRDR
jgi:NADPH-dependent curcumin reductase CurA